MKKLFTSVLILSIASAWSQRVDQFTGSYNHNFPLLHVPSNKGEGVGLEAIYRSGIRMNQPASEIGLGWDLNGAGEITRNMVGMPDDALNIISKYPKDINIANEITVNGQGALYPDEKTSNSKYDLVITRKGLDTTDFTFPAYDNFSVRGPGLSGNMKLSYFNFYGYTNKHCGVVNYNGTNIPYDPPFYTTPISGQVYRKPQFHFDGSFCDTFVSRHYPDRGININTLFREPTTVVTGLGYPAGSTNPYIGKHLNGATISNQHFDLNKGYLATQNLIEYVRNGQIDSTANGFGGYSYSGDLDNFVDYKVSHARPAGSFPAEGIGAFKITDGRGYTYHYALPVYQRQAINYRTPLNNDYSVPNSISINDFNSQNSPLYHPQNKLCIVKSYNDKVFAVKWLLTAITGPDYVDDGNHYPDDLDKGYWIRYDYVQWTSNFVTRSPQYGFSNEYTPDPATQDLPSYFPDVSANPLQAGLAFKYSGLYA